MINLKGLKFGRLKVISKAEKDKCGRMKWLCQCECGNYCVVREDNLKSGHTLSCGCYNYRTDEINVSRHGLRFTSIYNVWRNMRYRCKDENNKYYGEKGITVCNEWQDFNTFYNWAMTNGYKKGLTIDRIDNNGNYESANCRWVTELVQGNNKSNNINISYEGETHTLAQWSRKLKVNYETIRRRYYKNNNPKYVLFGNMPQEDEI